MEVDANEVKIDAVQSDVTSIKAKSDNFPADLDAEIILLKGAVGFNVVLDDFVYDINGKGTAGNMYIYDGPSRIATHVSPGGGPGLLKKILGVAVITSENTTFLSRKEA